MMKTRDIQPYHLATVAAVMTGNQMGPLRKSVFEMLPAAHALILAAGDLLHKARELEAARNAEKKEKDKEKMIASLETPFPPHMEVNHEPKT